MSDQVPMECPECGKDAVRQTPASRSSWRADRVAQPEWSHRDGSSLCPVIGPSGGYEPARPQPRQASPGVLSTQPGRPAMGETPWPLAGDLLADQHGGRSRPPDRRPQGRKADTVGTRYMRRLIAGLGDPSRPADARRELPEPEAGA
jgi:hypothetical protein